MLPVLNPSHNALVSLRYSAAILPLCAAFPSLGLTTSVFPWLALAPNGVMAVAAYRFWSKREDKRAKLLFWTSLVHLPLVLALAMVCKKGLWSSGEEGEVEEYEIVLEGEGENFGLSEESGEGNKVAVRV